MIQLPPPPRVCGRDGRTRTPAAPHPQPHNAEAQLIMRRRSLLSSFHFIAQEKFFGKKERESETHTHTHEYNRKEKNPCVEGAEIFLALIIFSKEPPNNFIRRNISLRTGFPCQPPPHLSLSFHFFNPLEAHFNEYSRLRTSVQSL